MGIPTSHLPVTLYDQNVSLTPSGNMKDVTSCDVHASRGLPRQLYKTTTRSLIGTELLFLDTLGNRLLDLLNTTRLRSNELYQEFITKGIQEP